MVKMELSTDRILTTHVGGDLIENYFGLGPMLRM